MHTRIVDTKQYVDVIRQLVEEGKEVSLLIAGNSMSPFLIHNRDYIYLRKPDRPLRRGDMVFYQRPNEQYVMHRICRVRPEGLYMVGDAQREIEGPLPQESVFAVVFFVMRKGKKIKPGDFWWEFFEHFWIRVIPLRRLFVSAYSRLFHKNSEEYHVE